MKSLVTNIRLQFNEHHQPELVLALSLPPQQAQEGVSKLKEVLAKGKKLEATIDKQKRKRSLDMNSYAWVLCQKLAEVIGSTKELVYQRFIKDVGQFEIVPIRDDAVERWIRNWNAKGLGWVSETLGDSKLEGYTNVISYYGSSVYDSREMSVLINEIVQECKELRIETKPEEEINSLIESWGEKG
ncbi:MAG TPA: hypothetical protein VFD33_02695 [Bacillota bacterium]|nr:hypothetical protein [Bacillota bacterium]